MTSEQRLTRDVKSLAIALGFDAVGIAGTEPGPDTAYLAEWLERGYGGEMHYLRRRLDERLDPRRVLEGASSAVVVSLGYSSSSVSSVSSSRSDSSSSAESSGSESSAKPAVESTVAQGGGPALARISQYAAGEDYHEVLRDRLRALETGMAVLAGERDVRSRAYVDTGPISERSLAARAGLGWIGKNTCLLDRERGSFVFLGVVLTTLALERDAPVSDHCGSCRACLDACPTDAFAAPYVLDATRCIAYTTIEDPGPIPAALRAAHGDRVFGCDVCQDVCPWNKPRDGGGAAGDPLGPLDPLGLRERLSPRPEWTRPPLEQLLELDAAAWLARTGRSPIRRARLRGLLRNALVAAGNSGDPALIPVVERHAAGDDPLLAEHAQWARDRLRASPPPGGDTG